MHKTESLDETQATARPAVSVVVIGLNEAATLGACFDSVRAANWNGLSHEFIYVDGGSEDDSLAIARAAGVDLILGGEGRRSAAENRNIGLAAARGEFVQFVDGDMALDPDWVRAGLAELEAHPGAAAVFGRLRERNQGVGYRALQIDWEYPEGPALYCGGAALFRRDALKAAGGFPEDVAYGEEPLLCWRLRNEHGYAIRHLHHRMADHDLAYDGLCDYWRRTVRVGETYAEIAALCRDTKDPFWSREVRANLRWGGVIGAGGVLFVLGPMPVRAALALIAAGVLGRKAWQRRGRGWPVAAVYALHTYGAQVAIAWGIVRWRLRRARGAG